MKESLSMARQRVLFLCTGNACRSQMAEGWARALRGSRIEACSAGIEKHGLNPSAVKVMSEAGVDISQQRSKTLDELVQASFDYVVTVCGHAHETCPRFPAKAKVIHVGFDDPPRLARHAENEEEALPHFRRVRDEIRQFVETLPDALEELWRSQASGFRRQASGPDPDSGVLESGSNLKPEA